MERGHDTQDLEQADLTANSELQGAQGGSLKPILWFFGGVALIIVLFLISEK